MDSMGGQSLRKLDPEFSVGRLQLSRQQALHSLGRFNYEDFSNEALFERNDNIGGSVREFFDGRVEVIHCRLFVGHRPWHLCWSAVY